MKKSVLLVLLAIVSACGGLYAQNPSASALPVTLGQSVVAITGPWKFHVGDDPRWADTNFDDSQWETADLPPTPQTTPSGSPSVGPVSGWTTRGHAGYAGYAWYRIKLRIRGAEGPLKLLAPERFSGGFQIFVNGHPAGSFGNFTGAVPELYYHNPAMFSVPASDYLPGPDGTTLLAFRFYMPSGELFLGGTGGMYGPPVIGLDTAATAVWHMQWEKEFRRLASALVAALMYFIFAVLISMIFAFSRIDKILLWPLAACVLYMLFYAFIFSTNAKWMSAVHLEALIDFAVIAGWYVWMLTWWAYFGLQHRRWLFNVIVVLGIVDLMKTEFFAIVLRAGKASHGLLVAKSVGDVSIIAASFLLMAAIAYLGWKGVERGKWPLLLALFFSTVQDLNPLMTFLHLRTNWQPFGVQLPLQLFCTVAILFFFSIVLFQHLRASLQKQQAMEEDVEQAKQIQQLLIPERLPNLPGWSIRSEYRPARQVGGDFFQIIPHPSDGSILIVTGDVTGKGLQAGMTVALLVGAIRNESEHTLDPIQVLKQLNRRLMVQERAQATCLALLLREDGAAKLVNAGHLPPYLNGVEMIIDGSLPLGMISEVEFPIAEFHLDPGDRLVLISDGVVEAQNELGDMFGFDRFRTLLSKEVSTAEIANTVQKFGQQDDISVLSLVRMPVTLGAAV